MGRIFRRIFERTIYHWTALCIFGNCGKSTYCIKPMRVINGKWVSVGNRVSILNSIRVEAYKKNIEDNSPIILIGDNTNIEQGVHITGGKKVIIGKDCSILSGCIITDIHHPYKEIDIPIEKQIIE